MYRVNTIFILDRNLRIIDTVSRAGDSSFFDDIYDIDLVTGTETFEFSVNDIERYSEKLAGLNYILFKFNGKFKLLQIMTEGYEHEEGNIITNIYCENTGISLINEPAPAGTITGDISDFLRIMLDQTNFEVGDIDSSLNKVITVEIDNKTNVLKAIQENISKFGCEIEFDVEVKNNRIVKQKIDAYKQRGSNKNKIFTFGKSVEAISKNIDWTDFCTAIKAYGKDDITVVGARWSISNGNPIDKPSDLDYVPNMEAHSVYNNNGRHIWGYYESEADDKYTLLQEAYEESLNRGKPKADYEVKVVYDDELSIGDTVKIRDFSFKPKPLFLEARVSKLKLSFSDETKCKAEFSNYKEIVSKIREPKDGEDGKTPEIGDNGNWVIGGIDTGKPSQGLTGPAGEPAKYVKVNGEQIFKYTNGFAGTPTPSVITITSSVIGITNPSRVWSYKTPSMSNYVNMSSTDATIVVMHNDSIWGGSKSITIRCSVGDKYDEITLVKVADGSQGIQGNGVKSTQEEFYLSSDKVNQPSETDPGWVSKCPQWQPGKYIWTRIKMTYTNNNVEYVGYSVDTSWEVVNDLEIGTVNLLTKDFIKKGNLSGVDGSVLPGTYAGYYRTKDFINIENSSKYVLKINEYNSGDRIEKIIAYTSTGTYISTHVINATTTIFTPPKNCKKIKFVVVLNNTSTSYIVEEFKIKLEKGTKPTDWTEAPEDTEAAIGEKVADVDVMFYLSSSNTELKDGKWETTAPKWTDGKYMWQKTVTTLGNGQTRESAPTCIAGAKGDSGYTIVLSNENHTFPCQSNGNIPSAITTTTKVIALKGTKEITPTIGTLPTVPGLTLTKSGATITIVANVGTKLADYGSFDIPITLEGIGFTKTFTWSKSKAGMNGSDGVDGDSPYYITLDAQNFMKYIDKNTPPIPTVIPITAYIHEGSKDITSNCTFRWYYITSNYPDLATYDAYEDTIVTLDGTDISVYDSVTTEWTEIAGVTGNTLEITYNSDIFFEKDIINIKVIATNNGDSISTEHTIYKVYDNKYITQQEIFDKLMENGNNFVYKDEETGLYYINASYIKAGQFVADLIKGGVLTLGGTGDNSLGDYGYMRVLNSDGTEEVAHLDGGDLWIKSLSVESINAKEVNAENVNNASLPSKLDENINVYVNANTGSDDVEFVEGSVYSSLQSAIDSIPNYINGKDIRIYLQTSVYEDIEIRGISGGGVYIYLCSKTIFGNVNIKNNSARIGIYGGNSTSKPTTNGIIKPSSFLTRNSKGFSVVTQSSTYVILQYVDIYGSVSSTDKSYYTALYAYDNANTIFNGGKIIGSDNAFRTDTMGKIHVFESYGYVNNYVFRAANMSNIGIASATQCNGVNKVSQDATSSINYSSSGIKWDGSTTSGKNDNTTTSSKSVTFKSNYGDTYRSSIYNSWKKDNTVRQGDYGYGDCNGCWFFGSQFANLKEKTITKVVLKIKRNSGGSGSSVNHVIKMHNHSSRPSGKPTYISGWSKSVSIAAGETKTITITDSTVLSAIKSGTMKGFGIQSSYSKANYSVCSGNITAIVTYK